jgi:uncharacterized protein YebE (UPF0316 family)
MLWSIGLYFILGFILDVIITLQYRAVMSAQPRFAAFLSILITLISMFIIQHLIVSNSALLIISYAVGTGGGTLVGMWKNNKQKEREKKNVQVSKL